MADHDRKEQAGRKGNANPVGTALKGAVVGAGIVVAGAVALKDKKNRDKVKKVLTDVKDQATKHMKKMHKRIKGKEGKVKKQLAESKGNVEEAAKSANDTLRHEAKDVKKALYKK
jgi:gas vesicle protein